MLDSLSLHGAASWVRSSSVENYSSRGNFPLKSRWRLTQFPKTLLDESINPGLVCAHIHSTAQAQKIPTFMSQTDECRQKIKKKAQPNKQTKPKPKNQTNNNNNNNNKKQRTPIMHHSRRLNVITSATGLKNGHTRKDFTKNGEPRDIA